MVVRLKSLAYAALCLGRFHDYRRIDHDYFLLCGYGWLIAINGFVLDFR